MLQGCNIMAITEYLQVTQLSIPHISLFVSLLLLSYLRHLAYRPSFPSNAPPLSKGNWPIVGALGFCTARQKFFKYWTQQSRSGNFSFYVGSSPVVGTSGDSGRKFFVEGRRLSLFEGGCLQFGAGSITDEMKNEEFGNRYFNSRLITLLKQENFGHYLDTMMNDTRNRFSELGEAGTMDPFVKIYDVVFQLTLRGVGVKEIADNLDMLYKFRTYFELLDNSFTTMTVLFPRVPTLGMIQRLYCGVKVRSMLNTIWQDRKKTGRREKDALQSLMDQGDDLNSMTAFIIGALEAGQVNTGIATPWTLLYLAKSRRWTAEVRKEINVAADKYCPDKSLGLMDRLGKVPLQGWETDFPIVDLCNRESIRIHTIRSGYRKNVSGRDLDLGNGEVLPKDTYLVYDFDDVHMNPEIYADPYEFDPSRYLPDRAEDKKRPYAALHWGAARHPCIGMRFAKLEMTLIVVFFVGMFDFSADRLPERVPQAFKSVKPKEPVWLKYSRRAESKV